MDSPLIRTKLHRPRVAEALIGRPRLLEYLQARHHRPLTLISAPAGYGKTTLLSQWLDQAPYQAAWLSLDEKDNELMVFLSYFIAAIRTLFPAACPTTQSLIAASPTPPLDHLAPTLINELADLPEEFMVVLDDYHLIDHSDIHQLIAALLQHAPPRLHLIITTRKDPPLSLARSRATRRLAELRMNDLRFTPEEVHSYVEVSLGAGVSPEILTVLAERTEGWAVGLRLACLSLRDQDDYAGFLETVHGTDQYIMEYLLDEILARQPRPVQAFLLGTSILDRFCAPLAETLLAIMPPEISGGPERPSGREILAQLEKDNLFVVPLDQQGEWFRYHHLFQDLLGHKLQIQTPPGQRAVLHTAAGRWLDQNGFFEEALRHYFAAGNTSAAAKLVTRQRYALLNQAQWQQLEQWLSRFSPHMLDQYPDLLMLKTWLIYHQGRWAELPAALQRLEAALTQATLATEEIRHLQGEMCAVRSLLSCTAVDPEKALAYAQQSIEKTPHELWIARILARLLMAIALQMMGDTSRAYTAIYRGFEEEEIQSIWFKATLVMTVCYLHWLTTNLQGMAQTAKESIKLSQDADMPEILNFGYFHLGQVCYQQNDLTAAEQHFATVVHQPYLNYGDCYANSACGLALIHQIQGRPDEARAVLEAASRFMLETGNTTLLPLIQAYQAEIALRQGHLAAAGRWATQLDPPPPLQPVYGFFSPHLTLGKVWLAQNTPGSRRQAADLLEKLRTFFETTHNPRFLIDTLALQALLYQSEGDYPNALDVLEKALTLAQPGCFIRLFVDFGPKMAGLLAELKSRRADEMQRYITQILAAFEKDEGETLRVKAEGKTHPSSPIPHALVEPLTSREQEVLDLLAQRLTDKEIAERLVISLHTVRTHTKSIYTKLNVNNRRQAVARGQELNLIPKAIPWLQKRSAD